MIHKRLLTFKGSTEWVEQQIYNSLPEGIRTFQRDSENSITVKIIIEKRPFLDNLERLIIRLINKLRYAGRGEC